MEKLTTAEFDEMYSLLKQSFIADELRPYAAQKALLEKSIYHVFAEREENGKTLKAFIAVWDFEKFVFVDYFAVHPTCRNQGLGEKMLKELRQLTQKEICLEIELPKDELTHRRLKFYERNHFVLCAFDYLQPPIAKGNAPVALSLMSTKNIVDQVEFEQIKRDIYQYAYAPFN